ncbi:MAG: MurR/RpiR family transcriptional regulator [Erysipelothrix sp.]|nr:MurR/RpiR family transcriptional regulator [Erysipelothrix sp.]
MSILIKIREHQNLSQSEKLIQEYILKNSREFLTLGVRDIALKTYTSPSTVVSFCKKIDPKGFIQLKLKLATEIDSYKNIKDVILDNSIIVQDDSFLDVVDKISAISIQSTEETRLLLD